MHVNLVHLNLLHPRKAILQKISGQTPHFLGENHNNTFFNAVAVECTLYLARPLILLEMEQGHC